MAQLTRMTKADKAWMTKFLAAKKARDAAIAQAAATTKQQPKQDKA